jgi:hypothetical protein
MCKILSDFIPSCCTTIYLLPCQIYEDIILVYDNKGSLNLSQIFGQYVKYGKNDNGLPKYHMAHPEGYETETGKQFLKIRNVGEQHVRYIF